jgi:hypothetical protein
MLHGALAVVVVFLLAAAAPPPPPPPVVVGVESCGRGRDQMFAGGSPSMRPSMGKEKKGSVRG